METKVEPDQKKDSYTLLFHIITLDDSIPPINKLTIYDLMHLREKIETNNTNKTSYEKSELSKTDRYNTFFRIVRDDDSIPVKDKLIIFKLMELKDKIKNSIAAFAFEQWVKNAELHVNTDYRASNSEIAQLKKLKSPFRRKHNSVAMEAGSTSEQQSSSTDSEKDSPQPKKLKNSVPKLPINASFHDKNYSPGRNSSSSADSPSSNKSSPIGSFFNKSPGRERFSESAPSIAPTPRTIPDDKKSPLYGRRKSSSGTNILRKSHSIPQNTFVEYPFKFPLDPIIVKQYLKEAHAKFAEAEKSALRLPCEDSRYELLVIPVDPSNIKKLQVFLLDKESIFGDGGTASTVCAWDLESKKLLVAKVFKKAWEKSINNEIKMLRITNRFHGFLNDPDTCPILLMKFIPGKNANNLLYDADSVDQYGEPHYTKKNTFAPFVTLKIVYKFLDRLSDLHKTKFTNNEFFTQFDKLEGLLHRDLKPTNLLLDIDPNTEEVKVDIIDYADMIPNQKDGNNSDTCCGSRGYTPPEVIGDNSQRKPYTFESDIYQAGVTIAEFITSAMYQVSIQEFLKDHEPFNDYWTVEHMHASMPNVFKTKCYETNHKLNDNSIELIVNEIIYKNIIFPALCELAVSMTHEKPALRLLGSSLDEEKNKLKQLEQMCLDLSKMYQSQIENALCTQKIFLDLSHILHTEQHNSTPIQAALSELIQTLSGTMLEPTRENNTLSFSS